MVLFLSWSEFFHTGELPHFRFSEGKHALLVLRSLLRGVGLRKLWSIEVVLVEVVVEESYGYSKGRL